MSKLLFRCPRRPTMWTKLLEICKDIHFVVACDDEIIGFVTVNPTRDENMPDTVLSCGYKTISLWVLDQNDRAKAFYEKSGFKADGTSKESGLGNTKEERYICELVVPKAN